MKVPRAMKLTNSFLYVSKKPYEFELSLKGDLRPENILEVLKEAVSILRADLLTTEALVKERGPTEEILFKFNVGPAE